MAIRVSTEGFRFTVLQRKKTLQFFQYGLLHNGPDTVEELLERHLETPKRNTDDDEDERVARERLTNTRREALALYRDIMRATRFFTWPNEKGILWRDILRANARQEFEDARFEKDPEIITRLLVGGHDSVQAAVDKAVERHRQIVDKERSGENWRS